MRGIWSTLALVVVLAGLGGYIYFVDSKRPASTSVDGEPARSKVFTVEADKVNEIRLTSKGQTALLPKPATASPAAPPRCRPTIYFKRRSVAFATWWHQWRRPRRKRRRSPIA